MKLALLSDIHANIEALEATLLHAKGQGVTHYAFLGDLVGYGAHPKEVIDIVMSMVGDGAFIIMGNHDQMAVNPPKISNQEDNLASISARWTHEQLTFKHKKFLTELSLTFSKNNLLFVHGSAHEPEKWRYEDSELNAESCLESALNNQKINHVFVGHVHHQALYYQGTGRGLMQFLPTPGIAIPVQNHRQWVVTVGSVGQPRDRDTRAMYAIYNEIDQRLIFHRVSYDFSESAMAIRNAGLPEFLAHRLEVGR